MALSGRGGSSTDKLGLRALQAGVAAAVDKSGVTPPVMIAHSMAVSNTRCVLVVVNAQVSRYPPTCCFPTIFFRGVR